MYFVSVASIAEKINNLERFNIDELEQEKQESYKPYVFYHGTESKTDMFTYRCGHCYFPINENDTTCKECKKIIKWKD